MKRENTEKRPAGHAPHASHRKSRSDSWWSSLPMDSLWEVYEFSLTHSVRESCAHAAEVLGVGKISDGQWYRFGRYMRPRYDERRLYQACLARAEAEGLSGEAGSVADTARAFLAVATEIAMRTGDAESASTWTHMAEELFRAEDRRRSIALRADAQKLSREKFEAAERRLEQVKQEVGRAREDGITPETLDRIEQAIGLL